MILGLIGLPFLPMASLQAWADIGQIVAGIAALIVVATVIPLYRQVRLQADALDRQVADGRVARVTGTTGVFISVSQVFIEHPKMRKYFHDGVMPKDAKYEQALAIGVMVADAMDHVAVHLDDMEERAQAAWTDYFNFIYDNSPVLRKYLGMHRGWYPELRKQLRLECADGSQSA